MYVCACVCACTCGCGCDCVYQRYDVEIPVSLARTIFWNLSLFRIGLESMLVSDAAALHTLANTLVNLVRYRIIMTLMSYVNLVRYHIVMTLMIYIRMYHQ